MPREPPIVLPVTLRLLGHANPWALLLAREAGFPLATAALLSGRYALKSDENPFAREQRVGVAVRTRLASRVRGAVRSRSNEV